MARGSEVGYFKCPAVETAADTLELFHLLQLLPVLLPHFRLSALHKNPKSLTDFRPI